MIPSMGRFIFRRGFMGTITVYSIASRGPCLLISSPFRRPSWVLSISGILDPPTNFVDINVAYVTAMGTASPLSSRLDSADFDVGQAGTRFTQAGTYVQLVYWTLTTSIGTHTAVVRAFSLTEGSITRSVDRAGTVE